MALGMTDRRPRQIIRVLALDQVGLEPRQQAPHLPAAQEQSVIRAARHLGRADGGGDCPPVLDHFVDFAGHDQQMAMRRMPKDMLALMAQIGADPAADRRPALGDVAQQAPAIGAFVHRPVAKRLRILSAHARLTRCAGESAMTAQTGRKASDNFTFGVRACDMHHYEFPYFRHSRGLARRLHY